MCWRRQSSLLEQFRNQNKQSSCYPSLVSTVDLPNYWLLNPQEHQREGGLKWVAELLLPQKLPRRLQWQSLNSPLRRYAWAFVGGMREVCCSRQSQLCSRICYKTIHQLDCPRYPKSKRLHCTGQFQIRSILIFKYYNLKLSLSHSFSKSQIWPQPLWPICTSPTLSL